MRAHAYILGVTTAPLAASSPVAAFCPQIASEDALGMAGGGGRGGATAALRRDLGLLT